MIRLFTLLIAASLTLFCCAAGQSPDAHTEPKSGGVKRVGIIEGRCAVIVRPDDKKIARMKRTSSQQGYDTVIDDNEYYMGISTAFLNSRKVKQLSRLAHGTLIFKSISGQYFKVSLARFEWGVLLFNGRTKPIEADVTDMEASYRNYMKK